MTGNLRKIRCGTFMANVSMINNLKLNGSGYRFVIIMVLSTPKPPKCYNNVKTGPVHSEEIENGSKIRNWT